MNEMLEYEMLEVNGGANGWKIVGGGLTIVGSIGGAIGSGGAAVIPAIVGAASGIAMIGDGLND